MNNPSTTFRSRGLLAIVLLAVAMLGGCGGATDFSTAGRLENGLVLILPGIEGESGLNHDIRNGLVAGGVDCAVSIRSWGRILPPPFGMLASQVDVIGNRLVARSIAKDVAEYQDKHPGKPVYIIGHSGGGGIAVFVAENMPDGHKVDGLILLSASISSAYDVTKALENTRRGIVNLYNKGDGMLLGVGTTLFGNVDGIRGPSAGLLSFDAPPEKASPSKHEAYKRLYQVQVTQEMSLGGSSHTSSTEPGFVSLYIAPWLLSPQWPLDTSGGAWSLGVPPQIPATLTPSARQR
ncbi:MAG: alpha/beta fold hydrolase [Planctomycetaceae bacterium]|nr:alpha/beta fold hydrolase [Planctomycetaceae bacterium]